MWCGVGILACLDGYMNIAMEQTEVGHTHCTASRRSTPTATKQRTIKLNRSDVMYWCDDD